MVAAASRDLSLALGRVVAHELVHALAPSVPHGTGLMSASLSYRLPARAVSSASPEARFSLAAKQKLQQRTVY